MLIHIEKNSRSKVERRYQSTPYQSVDLALVQLHVHQAKSDRVCLRTLVVQKRSVTMKLQCCHDVMCRIRQMLLEKDPAIRVMWARTNPTHATMHVTLVSNWSRG
jgi:hypothetical protein